MEETQRVIRNSYSREVILVKRTLYKSAYCATRSFSAAAAGCADACGNFCRSYCSGVGTNSSTLSDVSQQAFQTNSPGAW